MNDVRTDGNSDRTYGAENTAKGVAEQVKKNKKRGLNVTEQKVVRIRQNRCELCWR